MDRGKLKPLTSDEVERIRTWRNAPSVRGNMYTRHEIGPEEHMAWWQRTRDRADQKYFIYAQDCIPLGVVAFTAIDPASSHCAWAFYAAPSAPRGTGSRMEFLALDHAFGPLAMRKLHCEVLAFNAPVIKLHEKFGFQTEGIFRQHHNVDGEFVDVHRLALLAPQWAARRPELEHKVFSTRRTQ